MVTFVGDLIDPEPSQTGEPIVGGVDVGPHPGDDRPDGSPGNPHQLGDRGLGALRRQPQLLTSAGDNPDRITSEAAFAHLCGVAPVPASSGRVHRHRLNRGGDRNANNALYVVVINRLRYDSRSRAYAERRTQEGLSKPEIISCLKRYVAREIYHVLRRLRSAEEPVLSGLASA